MAGQCTGNTSMIFPGVPSRGPDPTIRHHCQDLLVGGRNSKHHLMYWDLLLDLLGLLTLTVGFFDG